MASEKKRKQADFDILSKIQAEKTKRGWSEYTLSKNSGIPQTTISTWYRNNLQPNVASIERICSAFNMTLSQFFCKDDSILIELTEEQMLLLNAWSALTKHQQSTLLEFIKTIPHQDDII